MLHSPIHILIINIIDLKTCCCPGVSQVDLIISLGARYFKAPSYEKSLNYFDFFTHLLLCLHQPAEAICIRI
jgi:hypothetical protein